MNSILQTARGIKIQDPIVIKSQGQLITDKSKIAYNFNDFFSDIGHNLAKNIKCIIPDNPIDYIKPNDLSIYHINALELKLKVLVNVCLVLKQRFRCLFNESN